MCFLFFLKFSFFCFFCFWMVFGVVSGFFLGFFILLASLRYFCGIVLGIFWQMLSVSRGVSFK